MGNRWREGWRIAWSWPFIRRGLKFLLLVGGLQIAINHGHAIVRGDVDLERAIRMVLTASVPYCVATVSGVLAHLQALRRSRAAVLAGPVSGSEVSPS